MIKLIRTDKPIELTDELVKSLTEEYINSKAQGKTKSVWSKSYIKKALSDISNKCCYCEVKLGEESKYMEVEHFHDKHTYPKEVIEWENLLPSCKRCNGKKSTHDTKKEPIINPTLNNPKDHLWLYCYRIKGKDELGKLTIDVLDLNDYDRLVRVRFEIGNQIQESLQSQIDIVTNYIKNSNNTIRAKNKIIKAYEGIMKQGFPNEAYSATTSCIILNSEEYTELKFKLKEASLWNTDFDEIEKQLKEIAFDVYIPRIRIE
jgi:uncharacterized protein (TIGR02646 family)